MHSNPGPLPGARQPSLFDDAAPHGGFAQRLSIAMSGWELSVAGDESLAAWEPLVLAELNRRYAKNEAAARKVVSDGSRLFRFWAVDDARTWADPDAALTTRWCWTARPGRGDVFKRVSQATARDRQSTAMALCTAAADLGAPIDPRAMIGERIAPATDFTSVRPLTDHEAALVRDRAESALAWSGLGVLVAAASSGGTANEIAALRLADVDLDAATIAFGGPAARLNPLDAWSAEMMKRFFADRRYEPLSDTDRLCVGTDADPVRAAHSITVRLGGVLSDTGLRGRPGVKARSIRLTTARRVLETDGIAAAARFLGAVSLDTTAAALRYRWQHDDG